MSLEHDEKYAESKMRDSYQRSGANLRQDILKGDDLAVLELHRDFKVKKAFIGTGHGVIASEHADWRTKANRRPLIVTRRQVTSLSMPSVR